MEAGRYAALADFARDFFGFVGRERAYLAALLIGGALVEGVGILLLVPLLGIVLGGGGGEGWLGGFTAQLLAWAPAGTRAAQLGIVLLLFAALLVVRAAVVLARGTMLARLQNDFVESRRVRNLRLLGGARWDVLARLRHGRVTHGLGGDM